MRVWPQRAADRAFIFITVYAATSSGAVTGGAGYAVQACRAQEAAGRPRDQEIRR